MIGAGSHQHVYASIVQLDEAGSSVPSTASADSCWYFGGVSTVLPSEAVVRRDHYAGAKLHGTFRSESLALFALGVPGVTH